VSTEALSKYTQLLSDYVDRRISAEQFSTRFMEEFKNETVIFGDPVFSILDGIFGDADAFCDDPALMDEDDLTDEQLHERCKVALAKLVAIEK
jgi:hypothetical protein